MRIFSGLAIATLLSGCIIVPLSPGSQTGSYGSYMTPTPQPSGAVQREKATTPIIASLTANPTTLASPDQEIIFHIIAVDASGAPSYHWAATGGLLTSNAGTRVGWRSPAEPGRYTVTVLVSSQSGGATTGAVNLEVRADRSVCIGGACEATPSVRPSPVPPAAPSATPAIF